MENQIFDIEGEKINTINISSRYRFLNPFVVKDILKKKDKVPEIKVFEDLEILKDIDFVLYGRELLEEERWAKRQRFSVHLRPVEAPVEKEFKKMIRLPSKHYIELDINNSKVRVVGAFVDLQEQWRWMEY
jgi:hypothetical protein